MTDGSEKKPDLSGVMAALNAPEAAARREANERKNAEEHPEAVDRRPYFDASGKYLPNEAGQWMIENAPAVKFGFDGDCVYYWDGLGYTRLTDESSILLDLNPRSKPQERFATYSYIKTRIMGDPHYPQASYDPYLIPFADGNVYDARMGEVRPITSGDFMLGCIPWPYENDPDGRADLTRYLSSLSDEPEFPDMIAEAMGLCLLGETNSHCKTYILHGPRSNGKSVLLSAFKAALGPGGYASIDLGKLASDQFATGETAGRRAAIYEELPDRPIDEVGFLKSQITATGWQSANPKMKTRYSYWPMTTAIGATNELPRWRDPTGAMAKRTIVIDMVKDFSEGSELCNPDIAEFVTSPRIVKALLAAGCEALTRLYENGWNYTRSDSVIANNEALLKEGNIYRTYISEVTEERGIPEDDYTPFLGHDTKEAYLDFQNWWKDSGRNPSRCPVFSTFSKGMCREMDARTSPRSDVLPDGTTHRYRVFACKPDRSD